MSGIVGASYFGGSYAAYNFAYGVNPRVAALSVHNTPITAGAKSLAVAFGFTTTQDGIQFYPLATNAPVNVGIDSNLESVTPSAVSAQNETYGGMNFTATFSDIHAEGDPVASGTVGLQEAINLAESNGGGKVIVDATWTAAGGTSGMISAAVFASPKIVDIVDNRS